MIRVFLRRRRRAYNSMYEYASTDAYALRCVCVCVDKQHNVLWRVSWFTLYVLDACIHLETR